MMRPAFRYHGGKFRLAPWILPHLPAHRCYVEPFGGAAGVLIQKPRSYAEVYNDLDGEVVNFFRVLREPGQREKLLEQLALTPYARAEFEQAFEPCDEPVERARRLAIRAQMGFGSAGATKGTTGFRIDTRRKYGTAQSLWASYPENLVRVAERFSAVLIENRPAVEVMRQHDAPDTLHFVDPPYVLSTRVRTDRKGTGYRYEMTDEDHQIMLGALLELSGLVVVCGYDNPIYREHLAGWTMHTTTARAAAHRGTVLRHECIWLNPRAAHSPAGLFFVERTA